MNNHEWPDSQDQSTGDGSNGSMSRSAYRQRLHQQLDEARQEASQVDEGLASSREEVANERQQTTANEKMLQLKRRLNIAIVGLVVAIVIVYLILFLVK